jgi:dipeptidyl-peptidase 4
LKLPFVALALSTAFFPFQLAQAAQPLTVADIYSHGNLTGNPPSDIVWSPDSTHAIYLNDDGDLMALDATGQAVIMVSHARFSALTSHPGTERDRDHRARYGQAGYVWGPDSSHILFDTDGNLILYSPKTGTGLQIGTTGEGSGDDPKFSPSGEIVSYVRNHNLYIRHLRNGDSVELPVTTSHDETLLSGEVDWVYEEELDVRSNYFWSPDSRRIAFLQTDETGVPEYPITDWIPTHAAVDRQRYPQPGDPNPSVRVCVVGLNSKKVNAIKLPISAGNDYIPRFGWLNSHTLWIETLTRDHKHRSVYFADADTTAWKQALVEDDDKFFPESYDIEFTSNEFFLTSWHDGHTHIYRYAFDTANPLSSPARLVNQVTGGDYEVGGIKSVDEAAKTIYYVSNEGNPTEQQVWAVQTDGTNKRRLSASAGFHEANFAPAGGLYIDQASDAMRPPTLSFCRADNCKAFWYSKSISDLDLVLAQDLELKAADGTTTLYGTLLMPSGAGSGIPLIINPYGGPGAQTVRNQWHNSSTLFDQLLAQHGFAVLHVDNRGMAGRGRDFEQAAYRNFGPVQLEDQLAAIDQVLAANPQLDGERLGWWGWSWGGTFTLYALTHSGRFEAGVSGAAVTDWHNYDSIYTERYMGLPSENPDGYHDNSVVSSAKELKGHLLLLHGTGDDNVHLGNSIQFIQQLINADIPYDFQVYPRKTHSVSGPETRTHLYGRIVQHFETYLK